MGAIRGILVVLVSVFLLLSLFSMTLFAILSSSLNYESVERESSTLIKDVFEQLNITNQVEEFYPLIQLYCQNNTEYVFNVKNYTINIPCGVALQGNDAILGEGVKDVIYQIYYTKSECNFLDCVKSGELAFFLSEKSHDFFENKLYFLLLISLVLLGILFFIVEKKTNMPILAGIFLVLSSLPFIKLDVLFSLISNNIISGFLKIFFSQSFPIAIRILILGIIFILLGIVFKIFKIGFFINNLISKITKKPVVEEKQKPKDSGNKLVKSSTKTKSK